MSDDALEKKSNSDLQWYEDEIPLRGCQLTLPQIKAAYRELTILAKNEGERIVSSLKKPDETSDEEFAKRNLFLKEDAFRLTVSVIGLDRQTKYGETEAIFDSKDLPFPIKAIFFTNENSFKRHASGNLPPNRFSMWLHFDKPPLFDPNPLVSEPTQNHSKIFINAVDVGFLRAVQNIVNIKIRSNRRWYSVIHQNFAYDVGLWFFALPYALYWITIISDQLLQSDGRYTSFRPALYIYGLGMSLLAYRALFSYLKWAFPVNVLEENKDRATRHRLTLGAIVFSIVVSGVKSVINTLALF